MSTVTRQSNFEALRIVAMTMIVVLHFFCCGLAETVWNYDIVKALRPFMRCGVDIFFMISGWFLIRTTRERIIRLLVYCLFFSVVGWILLDFTYVGIASRINEFYGNILAPVSGTHFWFIEVYFIVMLIAPVLNAGIEKLPLRQFNIIVICLSVVGMYGGFFYDNFAVVRGMSLYQGLWMYLLGRCLRLNSERIPNISSAKCFWVWFASCAVGGVVMYLTGYGAFEFNHSLFIVLGSAALMLCFSRLKFSSVWINRTAHCALGCYLFHTGPFFDYWLNAKVARLFAPVADSGHMEVFTFIAVGVVVFALISWAGAIVLTPIADKLAEWANKGVSLLTRKWSLIAVLLLPLAAMFTSCVDQPDYGRDPRDPYANFDLLAKTVGERYCFFEQKDIDWEALCRESRARINSKTTDIDLFFIMSELLDNLRDGHVNLISQFNTSYYRKWWSDYPQDFNKRTLEEYYLRFGGLYTSGMRYTMFVPDSIGYIYFPSFSTQVGEGNLDYVLAILQKSRGLIIDIRDNGGGLLTNVPTFVSRFIDKETVGGYIRHKTGPGKNDFSEPYKFTYKPCEPGRISYLGKPIAVLTNRSCYSAANDFVAVMKSLPQVEIIGARTGGGGGLPFTSELPNGWAVRFSAAPINDPNDRPVEDGIDPSDGCEVHCTPERLAEGIDDILNFAIKRLAAGAAINN